MSSAICFNLDQSKILLSGNDLTSGYTGSSSEMMYFQNLSVRMWVKMPEVKMP